MPTSIAFAVNVANLGRVSPPRVESRVLLRRINAGFRAAGLSARAEASFRHTGNFVVRHPSGERSEVRKSIGRTLRTDCVVISQSRLDSLVRQLEAFQSPRRVAGVRWTPGLVLRVDGRPSRTPLRHAPNVRLRSINSSAIAAWKRDYLLPGTRRLDPQRRAGGWGSVASAVASQLGGTWTARAISTVVGVLKRAKEAGAA